MSDRIAYAGTQRRGRPLLERRVGGPLNGIVRVVPIELDSGWASERGTIYSLEVEWDGPGLPELPPAPGPVHAHENYAVDDAELAQSAAREVADVLRDRVPDVRAILRRLASR